MKLIDKLERRFSRYAIDNLTKYLIVGQVMCMAAAMLQPAIAQKLQLIPNKVLGGELWRVFTFMIAMRSPQGSFDLLMSVFYFWIFWLMGNALNREWGAFRFNLYVLIGLILTFAAAWTAPNQITDSRFVYTSIFLAFAYLYPDFEILMFLIIPVKMRWIALLMWLAGVVLFLNGSWPEKCMLLASVANFTIFFGPEIVRNLARKKRRMAMDSEAAVQREKAFHECTRCGATDKTHVGMEFRYVPDNGSTQCVCMGCLEVDQ